MTVTQDYTNAQDYTMLIAGPTLYPLRHITLMYVCAKTVEPIEMPFVGLTHMGPRNHVLNGVDIPTGRGIFGVVRPAEKHQGSLLWCTNKRNHSILNQAIVDIRLRPRCAIAPPTLRPILIVSPINDKFTSLSYVHASKSVEYIYFSANVHRYHSNNSYDDVRFGNSSH